MITAELRGDVIALRSDYDFRDRDRIKQIPGTRYKDGAWTAPLTWTACLQLRGVFGAELEVGPALARWSQKVAQEYVRPNLLLRQELALPDDHPLSPAIQKWRDEELKLYPFQEAGVAFLATARRAYLGDEMGSGKTIQVARTLRLLQETGGKPFPAIVVAPKAMLRTWQKELVKWVPGITVTVISGSAVQRRKQIAEPADVYVINYEALRYHSRLAGYGSVRLKRCVVCDPTLADVAANAQARCHHCPKELNAKPWRTIVVDEAHRLKDPKALQTRALWALHTSETKNVYALSGTPIADAPDDLWSSLHLLDPDSFSNRSKYIERYCETRYNPFSAGVEVTGIYPVHRDEFYSILFPMFRRMTKEVVLPFLPRKTYQQRLIDLTPKQQKAYDQMVKSMISALDKGTLAAFDPLEQTTRLTQLASSYVEVVGDKVELTAPSNKIEALMELLEDMGDEPLVVMATSRRLIMLAAEELEKAKISYSLIIGGQDELERERAMDAFQNGRVRVILCTIAAGGVGVTLTRAGTVCFLQRSWSMIDNKQAEDRVHRIGSEQHDKIVVVDLVSAGTLEEHRQRLALEGKANRMEEVVRDADLLRAVLTGKGIE